MSVTQLAFDRLKGRENFCTWKTGAKAYLITKGHWKYMSEDLKSEASVAEKTNDLKALAELILLVDSSIYSHLEQCEKAKDGWDVLVSAFEDKGVVRKVSLLKQWISLKLVDCDSMHDYVSRCLTLRSKVKSAGFDINEEITGSMMLCGLSDEFKPMVMSIESKGKEITVDYVKNILLQETVFERQTDEKVLVVKHKRSNKIKKSIKCYECGGPHFKNKCPQLQNKSNLVLLAAQAGVLTNDWIIDSGATAHMTANKKKLSNKKTSIVNHVTVANNEKLSIMGIGDVNQRVGSNGKFYDLKLTNVQYVPNICTNLISVSQMEKKGHEIIFNKNGCRIVDEKKNIIATGSLIDNMFKLDTVSSELANVAKSSEQNCMTWHRRLGHASLKKMNLLLQSKYSLDNKCETCVKGKTSRKPFNNTGTRAKKLLEVIHSDVCGPVNITSYGGARYFVTFIDDYSRKVFVYTMKNKSEVFSKFMLFKKFVENQTENKIKVIRTDNGKEYVNTQFKNLCGSNGIKHEKSTVYTPQQNGLAERMNRTLSEKLRCMLIDMKINKQLWAEALYAAVNIVNILPNNATENKSPDQMWYKQKPNINNFKIFGCRALVMVPKEKRKKLDEKAIECIYLRTADDAKAYRLFNMNTREVIISRDVEFFENATVNINEMKKNDLYVDLKGNDEECTESDAGGEKENKKIYQRHNEDNSEAAEERVSDQQSDEEDFQDADNSRDDPTFETRTKLDIHRQRPITRAFDLNSLSSTHYVFLAEEPKTYENAMKSAEKEEWQLAMKEEHDALIKNGTWTLVKKPVGVNVIDNRWIYKIKRNTSDNSISRYKARLVARGFTQEFGVNYNETFSPVVRFTSIRLILAIAAIKRMKLQQFDVKTAFLNGELEDDVYMKQPIGFSDNSGKVCKLNKGLYGLKQASRVWNKKFKFFIELFGFIACKADPCVFVSNKNNQLLILAIHVDDGLIAGENSECINDVIVHLKTHFEIIHMNAGNFLGLEIEQYNNGSIFVHQAAYARRILKKFQMENCNAVAVPSDCNQVLENFNNSKASNCEYRELVGSLLYLALGTRPDISYAVGIVSRYLEQPKIAHEMALKRIFKYVKGTINYGILYNNTGEYKLDVYSDADYAGDATTRKSTSGSTFLFNGTIISWYSERQKCVSLSTMEAEYVAASNATKEILWLKQFLSEIFKNNNCKINFFLDNQSAIKLIKNPELHKRSKHIDVRYHFIRDAYENQSFDLKYTSTENMIADMLTKPLKRTRFSKLCTNMGMKTNRN